MRVRCIRQLTAQFTEWNRRGPVGPTLSSEWILDRMVSRCVTKVR